LNPQSLKLVLGSASPRRKKLMQEAGFIFRTLSADVDETPPPGLYEKDIAVFISEKKSRALLPKLEKDEILITADTIVCIDKIVLGKPADKIQALQMLNTLIGRNHHVYTGVTLADHNKTRSFFSQTEVSFNKLEQDQIQEYISVFKPFDKAGSYGAQECLPAGLNPCSEEEMEFMIQIGKPQLFVNSLEPEIAKHVPVIKSIKGSFFNVMGLPVSQLWQELENFIL
jgi:septum formation protein